MDEQQDEEFEHLPWSQLAADPPADRRRLVYAAAAVLIVGSLGAAVARALWPARTAATPVDPALEMSIPEEPPAPPSTIAALDTVPPPVLYSEADLLAGATGGHERIAAARAEWFVADYFTADRDPLGSLDVRKALPTTDAVPVLPHDGPVGGTTYVEWARSIGVTALDTDAYRVRVAFRAIGAVDGTAVVRFPVRAVDVVVAVGPGSVGLGIADLPAPAPVPTDTGLPPWESAPAEAPPEITAAALDEAGRWGDEPEIEAVTRAGPGWRVLVSAADEVGIRWPLAVWLDEAGGPAQPPLPAEPPAPGG